MPTAIIAGVAAWMGGGAVAVAIATFGVNLAISAILTKVFAPDKPGAFTPEVAKDSGVDARVSPDTSNKLPILYGENVVRGTVIMADMTSDSQKMGFILALGQGGISSVNSTSWDNNVLTLDADITTGFRNITNATDVDGVSHSYLNGNVKLRVYPNGGRCSEMESLSSSWNAGKHHRTLPNIAYAYVEVTYNREEGVTSLGDLSFDVTGKKVRVISGGVAGSVAYSNNPADVILDYLTDTTSGLSLLDSQIDMASMQTLKTFCDASINYTAIGGSTGTANRYTCNGSLNTNSSTSQNLKSLFSSCQSTLAFSLGKFGVVINTVKSVERNLGDDDLIGGISVSDSGFSGLVNELTLRYRSKSNNNKGDQVVLESPSGVKNFNEPLLEQTTDLRFTNNNIEAERVGTIMLNQYRQSLTAKFTTTVRHLDLSSGDIISITNETTGWDEKQFRVMSIFEKNQDVMTLEFTCLEYSTAVYTDITINEKDVAPNTNLLDPSVINGLSTLTATAQSTELPSIKVVWTVANDSYVDHYDLRYKKSTDTVYTVIPVKGLDHVINSLAETTLYNIEMRTVSTFGNKSAYVSATATTLASSVIGAPGSDGVNGLSFRTIYIRSVSTPTTPTGGDLKGLPNTAPAGWSFTPPTGSTNQLWKAVVTHDAAADVYEKTSITFDGTTGTGNLDTFSITVGSDVYSGTFAAGLSSTQQASAINTRLSGSPD